MDPNANLAEQLQLALSLVNSDYEDAARLAELVLALHHWIAHGCFLPKAWDRARRDEAQRLVAAGMRMITVSDEREPCDACNGTGFVHGSCCRRCEGSMSRPKKGDEK
jgi:hypothetical protein